LASILLRLVAWIVLLSGLGVLGLLLQGLVYTPLDPLAQSFFYGTLLEAAALFLAFFLAFLLLYSAGALIKVILAIEENTRPAGRGEETAPSSPERDQEGQAVSQG
jgi:ABC-type Fe3+-siderophore transport system permease subunit